MKIVNTTQELVGTDITLSVDIMFEKSNKVNTAEVMVNFNYQNNNDHTEISASIINKDKIIELTENEEEILINKAIKMCQVEEEPNLEYGKGL